MRKFVRLFCCVLLFVLPFIVGNAEGAFVSEQSARIAAQNWINMSGNKFAKDIGSQIKDVTHLQGESYGNPGYYFMTLSPRGWLIVPADDSYEAILAFGEGNLSCEEYIKSPFAKILRVNSQESSKGNKAMSMNSQRVKKPQNKRWSILLQQTNYQGAGTLSSVAKQEILNDVIVDKLLGDNNWQQRELIAFDANGNANAVIPLFFNRYVTWDDDIRYPVGCLPLATSQIMRYYGHPTTPPMFGGTIPLVGQSLNVSIRNDVGIERRQTTIKGGTNSNGSYNWSLMPNNLNASVFSNLAGDRPGDGNIVSNPDSYEYRVREEISRLLH